MSSSGQATLTTEAKDLELLWHGSEQGDFTTLGSWSIWVSIWPGTALLYRNFTVLLLVPGEKTRVCILSLAGDITRNITQASDCGGMNVSEREYIKNLTNRKASEVRSVHGADRNCRTDILGSPSRPTRGHLLKSSGSQYLLPDIASSNPPKSFLTAVYPLSSSK